MVPAPERCPVCDGSLRAATPAAPPDRVLRCLSCGHGVHPGSSPLELAWRDGPATPLQVGHPGGFSWTEFDRAWLRLQRLRELLPSAGALLDLDSGRGAFPAIVSAGPFQLRCAALCDVPPEQSFDAVTLWAGLDGTDTPVDDLVRMRRHLRPGGILIVAVRTSVALSGVQAFTPESLALALQRAGLDPISPRGSGVVSSDVAARAAEMLERVPSLAHLAAWLERPLGWLEQLARLQEPQSELVMAARRPAIPGNPS